MEKKMKIDEEMLENVNGGMVYRARPAAEKGEKEMPSLMGVAEEISDVFVKKFGPGEKIIISERAPKC